MVKQSKKGQGLSTSTIILLILGLVILVVLIWGFVTGWNVFKPLVSPTNVDNVIQDCTSACSVNSKFSYCSAERTLNVNEDSLNIKSTCAVFSHASAFSKYSIPDCPTISCDLKCSDIKVNGKTGSSSVKAGYDVSSIATDTTSAGQTCFVSK